MELSQYPSDIIKKNQGKISQLEESLSLQLLYSLNQEIFEANLELKNQNELNCNESPKIYTGETRRKLIERIKEQNNDGEKDKKKENITGLSQHMKDTRHAAALESIKIIIYENNSKKNKFKEAARITFHKKDQLMNKKEERKTISNLLNKH